MVSNQSHQGGDRTCRSPSRQNDVGRELCDEDYQTWSINFTHRTSQETDVTSVVHVPRMSLTLQGGYLDSATRWNAETRNATIITHLKLHTIFGEYFMGCKVSPKDLRDLLSTARVYCMFGLLEEIYSIPCECVNCKISLTPALASKSRCLPFQRRTKEGRCLTCHSCLSCTCPRELSEHILLD